MIPAWIQLGFAYCFLILTGISASFYKKTKVSLFRFLGIFTGFLVLILILVTLLSFQKGLTTSTALMYRH